MQLDSPSLIAQNPIVTSVAVLSVALGIGANAAIFSLFNQMLAASAAGSRARAAGESASPGAEKRLDVVRPDWRMRRSVQLSDVPRPRARADGVHRHRGSPRFGASLASGDDGGWRRHAVPGQLLLGARRHSRSSAGCSAPTMTATRWRPRRRSQLRILAASIRLPAGRDWQDAIGQRAAVDRRRRRAAGFHGTTLGHARRVYVPISMREILVPRWTGLDEPSQLLGVSVRAPQAWRLDATRLARASTRTIASILNEVDVPLQRA